MGKKPTYSKEEEEHFKRFAEESSVTVTFVKAEFENTLTNPALVSNEYLQTQQSKRTYALSMTRAIILDKVRKQKEDGEVD